MQIMKEDDLLDRKTALLKQVEEIDAQINLVENTTTPAPAANTTTPEANASANATADDAAAAGFPVWGWALVVVGLGGAVGGGLWWRSRSSTEEGGDEMYSRYVNDSLI